MALIEVKDLEKVFRNEGVETPALRGVSFNVESGEFVAIMGPSGSGKSTLMHILGFLDRPTSGTYKFQDRFVEELTDDEMAETRNFDIGFVFQTFNLLRRTTVYENIRLPLLYSKIHGAAKQKEMIMRAAEAVGLGHRLQHLSNQLSGGEQARVAIARAIILEPAVIFADEPTGNLDSKAGQKIMDIFQKLNQEGHTVILVTHETYTARHAKRMLKVADGLLVSDEAILESERVLARDGELIK